MRRSGCSSVVSPIQIFLGHYWNRGDTPEKLTGYAACLDFSVEDKETDKGKLVAYMYSRRERDSEPPFCSRTLSLRQLAQLRRARKPPMHIANKPTRQELAAYAATLTIALAIGLGTLLPNEQLPDMQTGDKAIHLIAFALLTLPLSFAGAVGRVKLVAMSLFFGAAIELIQPYVGRSGEWLDLGADAVGGAIGTLVGVCLSAGVKHWRGKRQASESRQG